MMHLRSMFVLLAAVFLLAGCEPGAPPATTPPKAAPTTKAPAAAAEPVGKKTALNKQQTLFLETLPGGKRRVLIESEVVLREGQLELFLCKKMTKEHEAILAADVDARQIHATLLAIGAKNGSTVRYQPVYRPASGTTIDVRLRYQNEKGEEVTVPARSWIRNITTMKELDRNWVFAGSQFYQDPEDKNAEPFYTANRGDVICVSNFPDAMLDLPINSPKDNDSLAFEAWTDRIPPLKTPVTVILEPVFDDKKDDDKKE